MTDDTIVALAALRADIKSKGDTLSDKKKKGIKAKFTHENGTTIKGRIIGPGIGPHGANYVTMHITPKELMKHGLDRERRHREEGMNRQVLRARLILTPDLLA